MDTFAIIEDAAAFVRLPKGIYKQTKVYERSCKLYIPFGSGFIQIKSDFNGPYKTSHPDILILELDCEGMTFEKFYGLLEPRYKRP